MCSSIIILLPKHLGSFPVFVMFFLLMFVNVSVFNLKFFVFKSTEDNIY